MLARLTSPHISKYFLISCLASIIDLIVSNSLYHFTNSNYLIACNLGIAVGFLFQYFVSIKYVFQSNRAIRSFVIYFLTFMLGLMLATTTMWVSYNVLSLAFLYSKLFSMAVPFFATYFVRKALLGVRKGEK